MLWIQRDPLGRIPGANEYAYCLGEPIDFYDPMGLYSMSDWGEIGESLLEGAHDGLIATTQAMVNSAIETAELVSPIKTAADLVNTLESAGLDTGDVGDTVRDVREFQQDLKDDFNDYMEEGLIDPDNPDLEASRIAGQIAFIALEAAATGGSGTAKRAAQAAAKAAGKSSQAAKDCATAGGKAASRVVGGGARSANPTATVHTGGLATKGGGRLGNQATRQHVADVATEMESRGWRITHGGGRFPEEYLPGPGGRRQGSSFLDITATKKGRTLRVNTIDTPADGITPTTRESRNAARIRSQKPGEHVLLVSKP